MAGIGRSSGRSSICPMRRGAIARSCVRLAGSQTCFLDSWIDSSLCDPCPKVFDHLGWQLARRWHLQICVLVQDGFHEERMIGRLAVQDVPASTSTKHGRSTIQKKLTVGFSRFCRMAFVTIFHQCWSNLVLEEVELVAFGILRKTGTKAKYQNDEGKTQQCIFATPSARLEPRMERGRAIRYIEIVPIEHIDFKCDFWAGTGRIRRSFKRGIYIL